jgi:hypothetical protein
MNEKDLTMVAAAIAGPLAAHAFNPTGKIQPGRLQEIATAAVAIALEVEKEAKAKVK